MTIPWLIFSGYGVPYYVKQGQTYLVYGELMSITPPTGVSQASLEVYNKTARIGIDPPLARSSFPPPDEGYTAGSWLNAPASDGWVFAAKINGSYTDTGLALTTVEDTYYIGRTRAISTGYALNNYVLRGSTVNAYFGAYNTGAAGYLNCAFALFDTYTLNMIYDWTFGGWKYVSTGSATSWVYSFTMPDADCYITTWFYSYDPAIKQAIPDYVVVALLFEASPRVISASVDKQTIPIYDSVNITGSITRGGTPVDYGSPIILLHQPPNTTQWNLVDLTKATPDGRFSFTRSLNRVGTHKFKVIHVPTWMS